MTCFNVTQFVYYPSLRSLPSLKHSSGWILNVWQQFCSKMYWSASSWGNSMIITLSHLIFPWLLRSLDSLQPAKRHLAAVLMRLLFSIAAHMEFIEFQSSNGIGTIATGWITRTPVTTENNCTQVLNKAIFSCLTSYISKHKKISF